LLVVISIVALLVALILPALAKARTAAKATLCMTNEKQIGMAVQYYLNDYKQFFPASYDGRVSNAPPTFWFMKLCYFYLDSTVGGPGNNDPWGTGKGSERIFICPEIPLRGANYLDRLTELGYGWNYLALTHKDFSDLTPLGGQTANLTMVERPSQTIAAGDTHDNLNAYVIKANYAYGWSSGVGAYVPLPRHLNRANFVMIDGHVEALNYQDGIETDQPYWRMKK